MFEKVINEVISKHWREDNMFVRRLFAAFDENKDGQIDIGEFLQGLSCFLKGTSSEKLELTFKVYDINGNGYVDKKELFNVMADMYKSLYNDDDIEHIRALVERVFADLDVNGDEQLSLEEFKLASLKEPMVLDFLQGVLE
eukprot:Colp12_sorted_trinity150504_noHs@237